MGFWISAVILAIIIGYYMWEAKPRLFAAVFIVSLYVEFEIYAYVYNWLSYLPIKQHILFYAIPVVVFLLASFVYSKITETSFEDAVSESSCQYIGVIIAVWLSFPTVFMLYDWQDAKAEYETEMENLFGEEWEDEVEEMEYERISRHP